MPLYILVGNAVFKLRNIPRHAHVSALWVASSVMVQSDGFSKMEKIRKQHLTSTKDIGKKSNNKEINVTETFCQKTKASHTELDITSNDTT